MTSLKYRIISSGGHSEEGNDVNYNSKKGEKGVHA